MMHFRIRRVLVATTVVVEPSVHEHLLTWYHTTIKKSSRNYQEKGQLV